MVLQLKMMQLLNAVSTEEAEASLPSQKSQELREVYESLSVGPELYGSPRRPYASLSPEDLNQSEWFYLMCLSFTFPPNIGLPGKAFAEQRHVWLATANEADSNLLPRAILAKSAGMQTIVCIPFADCVLELGHTEKVSIIDEDALLELQCPNREGLLLKIMHKLHHLLLEITSVQFSSTNHSYVPR